MNCQKSRREFVKKDRKDLTEDVENDKIQQETAASGLSGSPDFRGKVHMPL